MRQLRQSQEARETRPLRVGLGRRVTQTSEQSQIVRGFRNYFILSYWDPEKNFKKESDMVKSEFWEMERGLEGAKEKAGRRVRRLLWLPRRRGCL